MFDFTGLTSRLTSHAETLGLFESVNGHEPKNAPGHGLTAALWMQSIQPIRSSGLALTSGRVEYSVRVYTNMLAEPQDLIDPAVSGAVDALLSAYSGDFALGGTARHVDLLGIYGAPLGAAAGYLSQDNKLYRVMTVTVPVIVNDLWEQAP